MDPLNNCARRGVALSFHRLALGPPRIWDGRAKEEELVSNSTLHDPMRSTHGFLSVVELARQDGSHPADEPNGHYNHNDRTNQSQTRALLSFDPYFFRLLCLSAVWWPFSSPCKSRRTLMQDSCRAGVRAATLLPSRPSCSRVWRIAHQSHPVLARHARSA